MRIIKYRNDKEVLNKSITEFEGMQNIEHCLSCYCNGGTTQFECFTDGVITFKWNEFEDNVRLTFMADELYNEPEGRK